LRCLNRPVRRGYFFVKLLLQASARRLSSTFYVSAADPFRQLTSACLL